MTPVYAIQYAIRVLETVDRHGRDVTAAQLAREIDVPAGQLSQLLAMLQHEGYLHASADGAYVLGDSAILLGSGTRQQALTDKIRTVLTRLRDEVGAAVYFSRYDEGEVRIVDYADGPAAPKVNEWVDFRYAAHASAVGKCLLTQLDADGRREHVSRHKVARLTSKTITNEDVLLNTLDSQPPTVPTLDLQEYAVGTVCAAVPVTVGSTVGCLAVSMPLDRAHRLKKAADTLNKRSAPVLLSLAI
ncbi:helix-turn-helix domain-containing protein [Streptomyces sp. PTM05]|uniref:Helix-turn-helix domain-containing protein n=1 Tax=Streptantibioticus parmotrematis TaxID=2873249 RepID=A0ABS7QVR3_9ACTN|nr:IclR family transcriptional regulator C-terminal domain-containing protein [Streptantibioticus parmotrematis]MBY8886440.1 helix-turn-helix domain-containing protein [Streptantibioticus parmotrematis]